MIPMNKYLDRMKPGQAFTNDWMIAFAVIMSLILLGLIQFGWKLDSGFLPGGNLVSNFVPYFLIALLFAGFAVLASLTRPRGWKWGLRDLFWSPLLPVVSLALFVIYFPRATPEEITEFRSIVWTFGSAIAFDFVLNVVVPLFYHRWGTDVIPKPTVSLTASSVSVPAGTEIELVIASSAAEKASISQVGDVSPNGRVKVVMNATKTFKATVVGEGGTVDSGDVTVTVT